MKSAILNGIVLSLLVASSSVHAESLRGAGWRGDGSGRFADTTPPTRWSKDSKNIVWKTEVRRGYSSPVLLPGSTAKDGRIFLTAEPSDLICLNAATGEIVWQEPVGYAAALGEAEAMRINEKHTEFEQKKRAVSKEYETLKKQNPDSPRLAELKDRRSGIDNERKEFERQFPPEKRGGAGNTAATVVCDGERVFALFGTGIATAFTVDGERLWVKHLEGPTQGFGHSTSPVLAGGQLIVHIQHMIALDPRSGSEHWRADVPPKFGSPVVARIGGEDVIVTPSGCLVVASDGRILSQKQFQLSNNSPIVHDGVIYVHESGKVKAFALPESTTGQFELEMLWESTGARDQRMGSAVYHDGLLYAGGRRGILDVVDAKTGKVAYRRRLDIGEIFSSPSEAGGLIFLGGRSGQTLVLKPGQKFTEVATNESERYSSNALFSGNRMYLRTDRHLVCIEN